METLRLLTLLGNSDQTQGIAALGIDPIAILAQAVTFLLLFWVIKKFALDKIVKTLEDRRVTIDNGVRLGRKMEAEEQQLNQRIENQLKKARSEADKIIAQSKEDANSMIREAEEATARKVESMLVDAHAKIEDDIKKAKLALEADIRNLVAEASAIILEEKLDSTKDLSMIDKALAKVRSL